MRYRLTCLTPTLVGDGQRLSPIDYMVWKDHVNVLDQRRIFKLLAKGPRLEGYLAQLKRADRLDFASWGGFAQNFAGRRIPFENPSLAAFWQKARTENLHIPTFATSPAGPYVPGTAVKGALRTGLAFTRWTPETIREVGRRMQSERPPRRPAEQAEDATLGSSATVRMKPVSAGDSAPVAPAAMRVYLLRVASLEARGGGKYELGWKQAPRGSVDGRRPDDATPLFAEMADPGTIFEGDWQEHSFFSDPETLRAMHWKEFVGRGQIFEAANRYAERLLILHKQYAEWTNLVTLRQSLERLEERLAAVRSLGNACLLSIGWGGGLLNKSAYLDTQDEGYRAILRGLPFYGKAIRSGLPFPKTRRIVFLGNQPAALPGWILLEINNVS
ncbi:MAG TPA: type III-A CRISPR-associated RAMP protein Csm5 [Bryobacteraceae bacterium]|nr:type III-A CRISPR-associated RAMP protein Csm5 [Bryobacteraceae bacterium]